MSRDAARAAAAAIREGARRQVDRQRGGTARATVTRVSPLELDLHGSDLTLDADDVELSQDVRRYHASEGLKVGDVLVVTEVDEGDWIAQTVTSDSDVTPAGEGPKGDPGPPGPPGPTGSTGPTGPPGEISAADLRRGLFSVYRSGALSIPTSTIVLFDATEFDISGWYNPALGLYTPLVAGYYRLSWRLGAGAALTGTEYWSATLLKNGAAFKGSSIGTISAAFPSAVGTAVVFANGTTDAFAIRTSTNRAGSTVVSADPVQTFFQGERIG